MAKTNIPKDFSFEETLTEVQKLVADMQKGVSDFDHQVSMFKKGKSLIADCHAYLNEAEMEIKQLLNGQLADLEE